MSKLLLTGAGGYIGQALQTQLQSVGHEVLRAGRWWRSGGDDVALDLERDPPVSVADLHDMDAVVHLAGLAHVASGHEEVAERINVTGTRRLAECAAEAGVAHFLFLSSVQVHGRRDTGRPLTEQDAYAPADGYARSKMQAEQALRALVDQQRIAVTIVRSPAVYGPDAPGNLGRLAAWAAQGRPLPAAVQHARRSLIARANLCDLLIKLVDRTPAGLDTFLVRDGTDLSVGGLYSALCRAHGMRPRFVPGSRRLLEVMLRVAGRRATADALLGDLRIDDTHLRATLDWVAPIPLEVGLAELALGKSLRDQRGVRGRVDTLGT